MPELPEVETIKRGLESEINGAKITDIRFLWPKTLKGTTEKEFKKIVVGKTITGISRRAKNLIITLTGGVNLLLHMKMTGHLLVEPVEKKINKVGEWQDKNGPLSESYNQYIRAIFWLDNGKLMAFSDLRKFGYIKLLTDNSLNEFLSEYGPEPFSKDFTTDYLKNIFKGKKTAVKKVLIDQSIIAGIGNIYADEILWAAKIHPLTPAFRLSSEEIENISKSTKKILQRAVEMRGTSTSDFRDIEGEKGNYEQELAVYKKNGQKCPRDGAIIEKIKVGGRGTHFCPKEQRQKK